MKSLCQPCNFLNVFLSVFQLQENNVCKHVFWESKSYAHANSGALGTLIFEENINFEKSIVKL